VLYAIRFYDRNTNYEITDQLFATKQQVRFHYLDIALEL